MKTIPIWLALHFIVLFGYCQSAEGTHSDFSPKLNSYTRQQANALSFRHNPASLAYLEHMQASLLAEQRFRLKQLSWYEAGVIIPVHSGSFGFAGTTFGHFSHRQVAMTLAYGRKLNHIMAIGASFHYHGQKFTAETNKSVGVQSSVSLNLTEQIQTGFRIYFPFHINQENRESANIRPVYSTGFGYEISSDLALCALLEKVGRDETNLTAGISYKIGNRVFSRIGSELTRGSYFIGAGVQLNKLRLDVANSIHPQLGATPGLQLHYQLKNKE